MANHTISWQGHGCRISLHPLTRWTPVLLQGVKAFGSSCILPAALQGALLVSLYAPSYAEAVRANILAAGDQASRSIAAGALHAAAAAAASDSAAKTEADGGVPQNWRQKVKGMGELEGLVDQVLNQRQ